VHMIELVVLRTTGSIFVTRRCLRMKIKRTTVIVPRQQRKNYPGRIIKVEAFEPQGPQYRALSFPSATVDQEYQLFFHRPLLGNTPRHLEKTFYEESA